MELRDVVARAERAAVHQGAGHRLARAATQELYAAVRVLRNEHLKPIAQIARALRDQLPGLDRACRTPRRRMPSTLLAAEARAVRDVARAHEQWFVASGRRPEFLMKLDEAVVAMEQAWIRRERQVLLQVEATSALLLYLRLARQLVEILDCHVLSAFSGDEVKLAEWRVARRVQEKSGVRRNVGARAAGAGSPESVSGALLTLVAAA